MTGTTSIDDLPTGGANLGAPQQNIQLHTNEQYSIDARTNERTQLDNTMSSANIPPPNPNEYMKQVVSDVQAASAGGGLSLPSRDIPSETTHITQDQQTISNYIPVNTEDYIQKFQTPQEVIDVNAHKEEEKNKYDVLFNELQTPVLIFGLYFILQLPIVSKTIHSNLPLLFNNDGNANIKGYVFNGILMATSYYTVTKSMEFISV